MEGVGPWTVERVRGVSPDTMSNYWRALCLAAKVPPIRLHDARRTCGTLMHLQGEPIVVVSAWLGHADPAFTTRTCGHSQNDALKTRGDEFAASRVTVVSMRAGIEHAFTRSETCFRR
jgi:integrase